MSKSHTTATHMSADAADKFEEGLEGEDFGSIDDWETELGMKILKIQKVLSQPHGQANAPVHNLLTKKLAVCMASLEFLDENPKAAAVIGSNGGLQAVMSYITKQATEDAAKAETRRYSDKVKPFLPGYRLASSLQRQGGLINYNGPAQINNPQAGGSNPAQIPNPLIRRDLGAVI